MTRSLPPKASLRFLQKEAKDLLKAHKDDSPAACGLLKALRKFAQGLGTNCWLLSCRSKRPSMPWPWGMASRARRN